MTDPLGDLHGRIDRLEAESAIVRLSADYCRGADERDIDLFLSVWTLFLSVWTDDAVWQVSDEVAFVGHEQIRAGIERQWASTTRAFHWTSNPSITVSVDALTARARFDVHTQVELPDGSRLALAGAYLDECARVGGEWRLARRVARVDSQWSL